VWGAEALGLAPLDGEAGADVCVVGLGAAGLSAVLELRRLGRTVVGLDAATVAGGASGRNAGFALAGTAAFHHDAVATLGRSPAAALYRATLAELDGMEAGGEMRRVGSLRIAASAEEESDCEAHLAALAGDGFPGQWYDGPEGRGLLVPSDGVLEPRLRSLALARTALAAGARLHESSAVVDVAGTEVRTAAGLVRCDRAVVAVDGGLELVLPELAGRVRTARAQALATGPAPEVTFPRPVYARYGYDYWQQLPDGRVVLGGGRDLGGEAEWSAEASPTAPVQAYLDGLLARLGVGAAVTHRWAGLIAFTPDQVPLLEEVRPGVIAVGAYSGTGNVLGSMFGRAAARLAVGEPSGLP
jgi:glycine/D-amino acid oxidase-like deaminating enzyme